MLTRRYTLAGLGASLFAWAYRPRVVSASGSRDPRFLLINLRGGLDGLSAVPPIGDVAYLAARGRLAVPGSGTNAALPLDGFFGLNPALATLHKLYLVKQALIAHAVATPYRQRSHFDAQDVLESGFTGVGGRDGWLNRALEHVPKGAKVGTSSGLAVGATVPLVLRGSAPIVSWSPNVLPSADRDIIGRLLSVYDARDPLLAAALRSGVELDDMAARSDITSVGNNANRPNSINSAAAAAMAAARILALAEGPRIAALSIDGWDTHASQGPVSGRLFTLLQSLDLAINAVREGLSACWSDTVIVVVTEFGRTVRANGTGGTDHGIATIALVIGGAVAGGKVISDWPGLETSNLFEGRDLRATIDLRGVIAGVLAEHLGIQSAAITGSIFPGLPGAEVRRGLIDAV